MSGLTRMPGKERQLTVTLMGRVLSQMESRMQHTRGTAPPGWADLHNAARAPGVSKAGTDAPLRQGGGEPGADVEEGPPEGSAAVQAADAPPAKCMAVPFVPDNGAVQRAAPGGTQAQPPGGVYTSLAQVHVPGDGPMPLQFVAMGGPHETPGWPQPAMPGAPVVVAGQWTGVPWKSV